MKRAIAECGHSPAEHLALLIHYDLQVGHWQRGSGKKHDQPKPLDCLLPPEMRTTTRYGNARMTIDEAADFLGWELPT